MWSRKSKPKIESHVILYLECAHRDPMADDENQKMEGHMTLHLERKLKFSQQKQVAIILFGAAHLSR
jgi:hypothetical protein